jgi:hypothetical protein
MGYTHKWKFNAWDDNKATLTAIAPKDVIDAPIKWQRASELIQLIVKKAEERGIKVAGGNGKGKPKFTRKYISLNGAGDESHEAFAQVYDEPCAFDFCKTARNPYDLVVATSLLALKYVYGDNFAYDSDGITKENIKDEKNIAYWKSINYTPKIEEEWEQAYELWEEVEKEL